VEPGEPIRSAGGKQQGQGALQGRGEPLTPPPYPVSGSADTGLISCQRNDLCMARRPETGARLHLPPHGLHKPRPQCARDRSLAGRACKVSMTSLTSSAGSVNGLSRALAGTRSWLPEWRRSVGLSRHPRPLRGLSETGAAQRPLPARFVRAVVLGRQALCSCRSSPAARRRPRSVAAGQLGGWLRTERVLVSILQLESCNYPAARGRGRGSAPARNRHRQRSRSVHTSGPAVLCRRSNPWLFQRGRSTPRAGP
jgi:hypothetical protein